MEIYIAASISFLVGAIVTPTYLQGRRQRSRMLLSSTHADRAASLDDILRYAAKWEEFYEIRQLRGEWEAPLFLRGLELVTTTSELDSLQRELFYGHRRCTAEAVKKFHELMGVSPRPNAGQ